MADERTNGELADALREWALDRRKARDQYAVDEGLTDLLDAAAALLRTLDGERIEGWVSSELKRSKTFTEFTFNTVNIWENDQPAILILKAPQEPEKP